MKLDAYLKLSGKTEAQIAKAADTSQVTINRLKRGKRNATVSLLTRVCAATDWAVTLNDFAPDDEKGAPK